MNQTTSSESRKEIGVFKSSIWAKKWLCDDIEVRCNKRKELNFRGFAAGEIENKQKILNSE